MGKVIYLKDTESGIMNKVNIEVLAESVLEQYFTSDFPVEPARIAQKLGIPINQRVFKTYNGDIISGGIIKEHNEISIYVNANDSMNRKRFTIAHELGHFFLRHLDNKGEYVDLHREAIYNKSIEENDADEFAGCILMPKAAVEDKVRIMKDIGLEDRVIIEKLAHIFVVSREAMKVRLKNLNLI